MSQHNPSLSHLAHGFAKAASLFALTAALPALAGSPSLGCDCEVTIPKYAGGVMVGVEALYLATDVKDTEFAFHYASQSGVDTFRSRNIDSDQEWGYGLSLGYAVAGTGNDVRVSWLDFDNSSSKTLSRPGNQPGSLYAYVKDASPLFSMAEDPVSVDSVRGSMDVQHQRLDLEVAQAIKIGHDSVNLRFHSGLRYARIESKLKLAYFADDTLDCENMDATYSATSDWDGLGPRMGVDGTWHLNATFSLVADISAALLLGDGHAKQTNESEGDIIPPEALFGQYGSELGDEAVRASYDHQLVPVMDARLGVEASHMFANQSQLTVQAGYFLSHYFDVDTRLHESGTDIAFSGLYLGGSLVL